MTCRLLSYFALILALVTGPAHAGTLKKPPATLNPEMAYIVVEIGRLDNALLPGSLVFGRYDAVNADIAEPTPPPSGKRTSGGWVQDNRIYLLKPALQSGGRRLFIVELTPGLWTVEGANDTAFSLGSYTMQLARGTVTDLGVVSVYSDFPEGEKRDVLTTGRLLKGALMGGIFGSIMPPPTPKAINLRERASNDLALPSPLAQIARPVQWAGEVRFGNHLGGLVNRMGGRKARSSPPDVQQSGE